MNRKNNNEVTETTVANIGDETQLYQRPKARCDTRQPKLITDGIRIPDVGKYTGVGG
jgi:hypothetical protein